MQSIDLIERYVYGTRKDQTRDHPYRILAIGGSGFGKPNSSFNLISQQPDTDKIYLYAKVPFEAKHQFLINKRESNMILKLFLNAQMIWMIFTKTRKNTIQIRNVKY